MTENNEESKIVVDDDYKQQVEAEKEAIKQALDEKAQENAGAEMDMQMPPASFPMLVTTLASQAIANLGHMPDPIEGKPVIRKPLAKHFIDTLDMLEDKTKGNLTDEEAEMLNGTLHQLRMAFVAAPDEMPDATIPDEPPKSSLELPS